jgi:hypothetical protein
LSEDWLNELFGSGEFQDDTLGAFYCPYTNGAECALMTKGWQPQELCRDVECEQLKFFKPHHKKRKAA